MLVGCVALRLPGVSVWSGSPLALLLAPPGSSTATPPLVTSLEPQSEPVVFGGGGRSACDPVGSQSSGSSRVQEPSEVPPEEQVRSRPEPSSSDASWCLDPGSGCWFLEGLQMCGNIWSESISPHCRRRELKSDEGCWESARSCTLSQQVLVRLG